MYIHAARTRSVDGWAREMAESFDRWMDACESPIERMLIAALIGSGRLETRLHYQDHHDAWALGRTIWPKGRFPKCIGILTVSPVNLDAAFLFLQCPAVVDDEEIRIDAAIAIARQSGPQWIALECDGHEFHERTKEQAARDRSRDRALTRVGWSPIRFTGSELFRNPDGCVLELCDLVERVSAK